MATIPPSPISNSRYQRVFSDDDEIILVKTLYQLNKKLDSSQSSASRSSTEKLIIYNRINRVLGMKFTHNQLSDKIRRLKEKYMKQSRKNDLIKNPHDRRMFKLSHKIWGVDRTSDQTESENGADTDGDFEDLDGEEDVEEDEVEEENEDDDDDLEEDIKMGDEEESMEQQEENKEEEEDVEAEEEDSEDTMEGEEEDANVTAEVTEANGGITEANGGITVSNGGITGSRVREAKGKVAEANGAVTKAKGEVAIANGGVEKANGGVAKAKGKVAEADRESGEAYGSGLMVWSKEKEQVVLKKYPSLVSEFSKIYPDKLVWHEAFDLLGAEKLREMNEEWLLVRIQEAELMARRAELLQEQSKLMVEAFKSRSKRN